MALRVARLLVLLTLAVLGTATVAVADPVRLPGDRLIVPGQRIGPLRLGVPVEQVMALIGPGRTERVSSPNFPPSVMQSWDGESLTVLSDIATGRVLRISISDQGRSPWRSYATARGIRIGSFRKDVVAAYGKPDRTVTTPGMTSLFYDRLGIRLLHTHDPRQTIRNIRVLPRQ